MSSSRRSSLCIVAASMLTGAGFAAAPHVVLAAGLRMTVERPHFTCETRGATFSHVAFRAHRQPAMPARLPCCDGQLDCAQFLSTSTVLHPSRQLHS